MREARDADRAALTRRASPTNLVRRVGPGPSAAIVGGVVTAGAFGGAFLEPSVAHTAAVVMAAPEGVGAAIGLAAGLLAGVVGREVAHGYTHGDVAPFDHPDKITDQPKRFSSWGSGARRCVHPGPEIRPALYRVSVPGMSLAAAAAVVSGAADVAHMDPHLAAVILTASASVGAFSAATGLVTRRAARSAPQPHALGE